MRIPGRGISHLVAMAVATGVALAALAGCGESGTIETARSTTTTTASVASTTAAPETTTTTAAPEAQCTEDKVLADVRAARAAEGASGTVTKLEGLACEAGWAGACVWNSITEDTDCYQVYRWVADRWEYAGDWDVCPSALVALGAPADVADRLSQYCSDDEVGPPASFEFGCTDAAADAQTLGDYFAGQFSGYDSWADAPNFGTVAERTLGELVSRCGRDHAREAVGMMDVFGPTWRSFLDIVDAS